MTDDARSVVPEPRGVGEFLLYTTEDGETRMDVRMDGETVWLSLGQMTELFQRDKSVISRHIRNIFAEGELASGGVVADFATTASDGKTYAVTYFNLDVVISVGYRVKSPRGTQFRIWATQRLREYLVKGFTMDDARLKEGRRADYFDELVERIRDIRSSEKLFWRKVLDIYSTSIDYDPSVDVSRRFFATLQNKMHWAAHGHTAAEIIHERSDAERPNMGLTAWSGTRPRKEDIAVAKNYLQEDEIQALNLIVSLYLDFAELQAHGRKPMTMRGWIEKLDDFLRLSDREVLTHAGKISHEAAAAKAEVEYAQLRAIEADRPSRAERDFDVAMNRATQLGTSKTSREPK